MPRGLSGARTTQPCAGCGKSLTRLISQVRGGTWWCSNACQAAHQPPPASLSREPNPFRGQQDTRPCVNCGKPVTRYLSQAKIDRPWFCSASCRATHVGKQRVAAGTWQRPNKPHTGETIPCEVCGKPVYRQRAVLGRKYCSRACNAIGQTKTPVVKACAVCGKEMRLRPSEAARQYCSMPCQAIGKTTRPTGRMHNGRPVIQHEQGYFLIYEPEHPAAHKHNGRVLEHRWLVEQAIGRYLTPDEQVDHINQDRQDNRLDNLQVLSATDHTIKTNADRLLGEHRLKDRLAEYERRFGPLA
jgi:endogenous inhibitor of DNA gyrase (YacG/DUF329 family)